ncbi:hypothetical protein A5788_23315 [Gordonia sp. 852002-50816_SCH5313054-c]|nr:hypothetical protein A5788_23315 [Gordonia sp. 852002-50816_SCH5313054-c]
MSNVKKWVLQRPRPHVRPTSTQRGGLDKLDQRGGLDKLDQRSGLDKLDQRWSARPAAGRADQSRGPPAT